MNQGDNNSSSLARRTLLSIAMVCGSTVTLTLMLSLAAFLVCGRITAGPESDAKEAKTSAEETATPSKSLKDRDRTPVRAPKAI